MHLVTATLVVRTVDGLGVIRDDVPLGKTYRVDLDSAQDCAWFNHGTQQRSLLCVRDVDNDGWLPLDLLRIEADQ